jgi:hypothetical protein
MPSGKGSYKKGAFMKLAKKPVKKSKAVRLMLRK